MSSKQYETTVDLSILKVLLLSRDAEDASTLESALNLAKHLPMTMEKVESLSATLGKLRKGTVDAILLDLTDARSKQKESFLEIKQSAPNIPIIVLTDDTSKEMALEFVQRGAQDYLVKNEVTVEHLLKTVRCAVERRLAEKRARIQLERENATIHQILEFAPVAIVRLSRDLQIREANSTFIESLGIPDETLGRNICDMVPGLTPGSFHESIASERPVRLRQHAIRSYDDSIRYFNLVIWPTKKADGVVTGFVLICDDVTDNVRMTSQRDEFVATLAHDMKVPLVGAERYLQNILNGAAGKLSEQLMQGLSALRRSNKQLLWMVHNLLFAYQEQEGAELLAPAECNLELLLRECAHDLGPFAEGKRVRLATEIAEELPELMVDRLAIRRLILNLVDNAIKYSHEGGTVEIRADSDESNVYMRVIDTGKGISQELLPTLFQRFWREPGVPKASGSAGLGLYVCKKIAEGHGGTITCVSATGTGSEFVVALPFKKS